MSVMLDMPGCFSRLPTSCSAAPAPSVTPTASQRAELPLSDREPCISCPASSAGGVSSRFCKHTLVRIPRRGIRQPGPPGARRSAPRTPGQRRSVQPSGCQRTDASSSQRRSAHRDRARRTPGCAGQTGLQDDGAACPQNCATVTTTIFRSRIRSGSRFTSRSLIDLLMMTARLALCWSSSSLIGTSKNNSWSSSSVSFWWL